MIISKKIVLPLAAVAVIGAAAGVTAVSAASSPSGGTLAQAIASTFGLDQSKVQTVIDQYRSDQSANREAGYEQRLAQAVTDGKITGAQKDAILAEHNKLDAEIQAAMQKTGADRRTAMKAVRDEAQGWAKTNGVSPGWLLGLRPIRGMGRHMGMMPGGSPDGTTPSSSPSPSPAI